MTLPVVPTTNDCNGKTYIVTGSNTGLGFECAKHFVQLSAKRVILAVRTVDKGEAAKWVYVGEVLLDNTPEMPLRW